MTAGHLVSRSAGPTPSLEICKQRVTRRVLQLASGNTGREAENFDIFLLTVSWLPFQSPPTALWLKRLWSHGKPSSSVIWAVGGSGDVEMGGWGEAAYIVQRTFLVWSASCFSFNNLSPQKVPMKRLHYLRRRDHDSYITVKIHYIVYGVPSIMPRGKNELC